MLNIWPTLCFNGSPPWFKIEISGALFLKTDAQTTHTSFSTSYLNWSRVGNYQGYLNLLVIPNMQPGWKTLAKLTPGAQVLTLASSIALYFTLVSAP